MGSMVILNRKGHDVVTWDRTDDDQVRTARSRFNDERRDGKIAYSVRSGAVLKEFDPQEDEIRFVTQVAGG